MRLALIVEGDTDAEVYQALISRIRDDAEDIRVRSCGGKYRVKTKFVGFLKEFEANKAHRPDKALVIRDSDRGNAAQLEQQLRDILETSKFKPAFPVHFYSVRCMIEAWLLADETAIRSVAVSRQKHPDIQPIDQDLESCKDAKNLFSTALSQAQLPAVPKVYGEIARVADLDRLRQRCPYFRNFEKLAHDC